MRFPILCITHASLSKIDNPISELSDFITENNYRHHEMTINILICHNQSYLYVYSSDIPDIKEKILE